MSTWYVANNGNQEGPYTLDSIQTQVKKGIYSPQTLVWTEGFADWKEIAQCPEFQGDTTLSSSPPLLADYDPGFYL